jgi:hypothetical protein
MNPAGDPTIFIPMGVHVESPAGFKLKNWYFYSQSLLSSKTIKT